MPRPGKLHRLAGFRSTTGWLAEHGGASSMEITVARQLKAFPAVHAALLEGRLALTAGKQLQTVLGRLPPHLDRPDGLLDGRAADAAVTNVITDGIRMVAAQARGGFPTLTEPALKLLLQQLPRIAALAVPQLARVKHALILPAQHIEGAQLPAALEMLIGALLPSQLDDAARDGEGRRYLKLTATPDGGAYDLHGRLSLLCGERLALVLDAALRNDPDNVLDTATAAELRQQRLDPHDPDLAPTRSPRNRGQRRHDAFDRALATYLGADSAGSHDKNPVQLGVTLTHPTLDGAPGALPAVSSIARCSPRRSGAAWLALGRSPDLCRTCAARSSRPATPAGR